MEVVYIAGPYTARLQRDIEKNVERARQVAIELLQQGYAVICPHTMTHRFEKEIPDVKVFYESDCELVRRCDSIYMLMFYTDSRGAMRELQVARDCGKRIYFEGSEKCGIPGVGREPFQGGEFTRDDLQ